MADHLVLEVVALVTGGGLHVVLGVWSGHTAARHQNHDVPDVRDVGDGLQGVVDEDLLAGRQNHEFAGHSGPTLRPVLVLY